MQNISSLIQEEYFYAEKEPLTKSIKMNYNKNKGEGLLMERGKHFCKKYPCFEDNFKVLFNHGDPQLFNNENLQFIINSDRDSQEKLKLFIKEIGSLPIKEKYPDADVVIRKYSVSNI
jgi:hypothetical protein